MRKDQSYINDLLKQYRDGSISAEHRHELECIALDDPFVFDSLEGYALSGSDHSKEAVGRIKSKTEAPQGRIINMRAISIAAGIAFLVTALFWVNGQLSRSSRDSFSQIDKEIAIEQKEVTPKNVRAGSAVEDEIEDLGNIDTTTSFTIENRKLRPEQDKIPKVESTRSLTTITNDANQGDAMTISDDSSHNDAATTAKLEVDSALPPPAAPAKGRASSRARSTQATGAMQKKKESLMDDVPVKDMQEDGARYAESRMAESQIHNRFPVSAVQRLPEMEKRFIDGIVTDNTGEPLIGANILAPNTDIAVSTDVDGRFSLQVDSSVNELNIAYVGFEDLVIEIDTSSSYDIILDDDMAILDEVVVTGYASNANSSQPAYVLPPDGRSVYKKVVESKAQSGCNESGKVKLKFTVTKYGEVTDFEIKRGLSDECNQRAIDIIKSSGTWNNQFNKDKKVRYTITF